MADIQITDLTAITAGALAAGDLFVVVDVSDSTMAGSGTDKKITKAEVDSLYDVAGTAAAHAALTTSVHGITDTSTLYRSGGTDVAVADGGTGASTATNARTNLGLVIGTDVAAATAVARANHTGTQLAATISDLSTAAYIPGGTDVPVTDGGSGASTSAGARTNFGLVIGTDVAAQTHATQHKTGGTDAIKLDELAAPTDVTTLNASTSAHGLLKKLSNSSTEFMNGQGNWATPAGVVGNLLYLNANYI